MPDEKYMQRALELARLDIGQVSPNPMVGCVIVHNDMIIGEGWHKKYGEAHAEVNAVKSVKDLSLLRESDIYVTLEPCSHYGKTPPCTDLLIQLKVKRVIIAMKDPNPLIGGKGIRKLHDADILVHTGLLESKARRLNKRFLSAMEKKRPYIILKWAQTSDGFIARENYDSKWISSEYSRQVVHKWRTEEDSILVGANTVRYDNPRLNARDWPGKDPVRIVLDKNNELKESYHVFDGSVPTLVYNKLIEKNKESVNWIKVSTDSFLTGIMEDLHQRNIQSILVEGGRMILQSFIDSGIWDEARVFTAPIQFDKGIPAPATNHMIRKFQKLIMDDLLTFYKPG